MFHFYTPPPSPAPKNYKNGTLALIVPRKSIIQFEARRQVLPVHCFYKHKGYKHIKAKNYVKNK